ncbi:MAG: SAM-dependent methyltransferase [Sulfolobales archaeon]|nr:SAM-dependent methyltransferase [Ignisphaera sp.]MCX8199757.1 SAM-dependent methyltransferase [Sulfolobales archaeon]MDW8085006.1 SAM-dependent methyltransferase [Ignisphaera sp.]
MIVIVEHLEPCISKWLLKEYEFVSEVFKNRVIFTNVAKDHDRSLLEPLGIIYKTSAVELLQDEKNVIVLDPSAKEKLQVNDMRMARYVVIGGIMGDNPPKGRTRLQITSRLKNAIPKNIGEKQFTIAGAAYILRQVELGRNVDDVKYVFGLKIKKKLTNDIEIEVELPYAFPLDEQGNVVLPRNYQDIILEHALVFESALLTSKHDVC